ncbi:unnamed protein product, partial [Ixodes pacificus]
QGPAVVRNIGSYKTTLVGGQECSMGEEDFPALGDSMRTPAWGKPNRVGDAGCRPKGGPPNPPAAVGDSGKTKIVVVDVCLSP